MVNYEKKFVELYKEADFVSREEEKLSDEEWKKRCDKLFETSKKTQEDIDKDIEKLSTTKRLFKRIDGRRCDMIAYQIEDDCKNKPKECPTEIKKILIDKLKEELYHPWTSPETKERLKKEIENLEK